MAFFSVFLLKFLLLFPAPKDNGIPKSIYEIKVRPLIAGEMIDFNNFRGKKIMIVNTASRCGNTPQYAALQALYERYNGNLVIVGFPTNDFAEQEPGDSLQIDEFCKHKYHVTFPMAAKCTTKGKNTAEIYKWLTDKKYNGFKDSKVTWNFQKYIINEEGRLIAVIDPGTKPNAPEVIAAIEQ